MRYIILVILNLPVILLALVNIVTQYKLKKVSKNRFRHQFIMWFAILVILISSFPVYNSLAGRPPLDSTELTVFDIVQTTAIIFALYALNRQRQATEQADSRLRDLHQQLSISLSSNDLRKP